MLAFSAETGRYRGSLKLAGLVEVREQGYAIDREEITRGITCVAAPILGFDGEVMGAISVTFPSYIEGDRGFQREIKAVRRHASAISGALEKG